MSPPRAALVVGHAFVVGGCGPTARSAGGPPWPAAPAAATLAERVVWDFERATLAGVDHFAGLFDFAEVGAFEILLHRYDLLGRLPDLTAAERAQYEGEQPVPYPAARERRNVSRFFPSFVQRTVGTGGCAGGPPAYKYNRLLGVPFEALPPEHAHYEPLRARINAQLDGGGVIAVRCQGGRGSLALVYSPRPTPRGYDLVTIYDDGD